MNFSLSALAGAHACTIINIIILKNFLTHAHSFQFRPLENCRFSAKPKCHTFKSSTSSTFLSTKLWREVRREFYRTSPWCSDGNSPAQQRWLQSASLSYWTISIFPAPPSLNLEKQRENFHSNALRTAQHSKQCSLFQNISLMERTLQLKFLAFCSLWRVFIIL